VTIQSARENGTVGNVQSGIKKIQTILTPTICRKKLESARQKEQLPPSISKEGHQYRPRPPCFFRLPINPIEGVIQTELLVIIDYVIKIQIFHLQKRMRKNRVVNKGSPLH